jgi:hypothetical protein
VEAALLGLFVNLRATYLFATANHIDLGLLAAHELADDLVDEAILDQRFNSFWCLHRCWIAVFCMIP